VFKHFCAKLLGDCKAFNPAQYLLGLTGFQLT